MRKLSIVFLLILLISPVFAKDGYEIMKAVRDREEGSTSSYDLVMILVNKSGARRERRLNYCHKKYDDGDKSLMTFLSPKDVKGVAYLVYSYKEDKSDDMWLYMPSLSKIRRVSGSGSAESFMGTDFSYEDMGSRELSKDDFFILDDKECFGISCYQVEAISRDVKDRIRKRVIFVEKETFLIRRIEYYDAGSRLVKLLQVPDTTTVSGVYTASKMSMQDILKNHTTLIEMENITMNVELDDRLFAVTSLERGGK